MLLLSFSAGPHRYEHGLRRLMDGWTGAMLGALAYALWALAVNWSEGVALAGRIALTHWVMSTLLTVYGTAVMRACSGFGRSTGERALCAFVGGMSLTYVVLIGVHLLIGTPHIALTLAAGVIPTTLFCGGYTLLLMRTQNPDVAAPVAASSH